MSAILEKILSGTSVRKALSEWYVGEPDDASLGAAISDYTKKNSKYGFKVVPTNLGFIGDYITSREGNKYVVVKKESLGKPGTYLIYAGNKPYSNPLFAPEEDKKFDSLDDVLLYLKDFDPIRADAKFFIGADIGDIFMVNLQDFDKNLPDEEYDLKIYRFAGDKGDTAIFKYKSKMVWVKYDLDGFPVDGGYLKDGSLKESQLIKEDDEEYWNYVSRLYAQYGEDDEVLRAADYFDVSPSAFEYDYATYYRDQIGEAVEPIDFEADLKSFATDDYQGRDGDYPESDVPDTIYVFKNEIECSFKNTSESSAKHWLASFLKDHGFTFKNLSARQDGDYHDDWVVSYATVTGKNVNESAYWDMNKAEVLKTLSIAINKLQPQDFYNVTDKFVFVVDLFNAYHDIIGSSVIMATFGDAETLTMAMQGNDKYDFVRTKARTIARTIVDSMSKKGVVRAICEFFGTAVEELAMDNATRDLIRFSVAYDVKDGKKPEFKQFNFVNPYWQKLQTNLKEARTFAVGDKFTFKDKYGVSHECTVIKKKDVDDYHDELHLADMTFSYPTFSDPHVETVPVYRSEQRDSYGDEYFVSDRKNGIASWIFPNRR